MVNKRGSSLIELVVVIGLISLLALSMSAIMLTTIISSNRVRRLTQIKQAGDLALTQMQILIRNSRSIDSCDPTTPELTTVNLDGGTTTITPELSNNVNRIASNSGTYLTPDSMTVSAFTLTCEPDALEPTLFKISFDLTQADSSGNTLENSTLHFETTTNLRND